MKPQNSDDVREQENQRSFWVRARHWFFSTNSVVETSRSENEKTVSDAPSREAAPVAVPENIQQLNARVAELDRIIEKNQSKESSRKSWGSFFLGAGVFNGIGVVGVVVLLALVPVTGPVGIAAIATAAVFMVASAACYLAAFFSRKTVNRAIQEKEILLKEINTKKSNEETLFREMQKRTTEERDSARGRFYRAEGTIKDLESQLVAVKEDAAKQIAAAHDKEAATIERMRNQVTALSAAKKELAAQVKAKDTEFLNAVQKHHALLKTIENDVIGEVAKLYEQYLLNAENKEPVEVQNTVETALNNIENAERNRPEVRFSEKWELARGWMATLAIYYEDKYNELASVQSPDAENAIQHTLAEAEARKSLLAHKVREGQSLISLVKKMYLQYLQEELGNDVTEAQKLVDARFTVDEKDKLGTAPFIAATQILSQIQEGMRFKKRRAPSPGAANATSTEAPVLMALTTARGRAKSYAVITGVSPNKTPSPVLAKDFSQIISMDFDDTEKKQAMLRAEYCQFLLREIIRPLCMKHAGTYWNSTALLLSPERAADYELIAAALSVVYTLKPADFPEDDFIVYENNTRSLSVDEVRGYSGPMGFVYPNNLESVLASDRRISYFLNAQSSDLSAEEKLAKIESLSVLFAQDNKNVEAYNRFQKEHQEIALELAPALSLTSEKKLRMSGAKP